MRWVPGGSFAMGSDRDYPEEAPSHRFEVEGFWIDECAVTNAEFARFVDQTGYVTTAEKPPDRLLYPDAEPESLVPGSGVFAMADGPVDLSDPMRWWAWTPGADWCHPWGPDSSIDGKAEHPVVHVSYEDAKAYARWAGKRLPTEAQWERAARGGIEGAEFPWGEELAPGAEERMNRWIGEFPWRFEGGPGGAVPDTMPTRSFPPNDFGLFEMTGNAWEWTRSWFRGRHPAPSSPCCSPAEPPGAGMRASRDPASGIPRKTIKGGSFLCAENYCSRYRPAARIPETVESSTCHLSFRCVAPAG